MSRQGEVEMTRDMIFAMAPATNLCNNNMHSPKLTDRSEANSIQFQKANEERLSDIKVVNVQRKSTRVSKCETKERQY